MIVEMTVHHLRDVMADLSDQTRAELTAMRRDEAELLPRFLWFMMASSRMQGRAFLASDGKTLAVWAIAEHEGIASTFMIAATGFFEASLRHVRELRRHMAAMAEEFGSVYVFSQSPRPDAGKWFKLLGAVEYRIEGRENVYRWG